MGEGEHTELAPSETETASVYAWGLAEYDEEYPTTRRLSPSRITGAAVAASLAAVAVAGVLGWQHLQRDGTVEAAPSMVSAAPMTTTEVPTVEAEAPPSPTVVTITTVIKQVPPGWLPTTAKQAPPPVAQEPTMTAYDRQFLQNLQTRWGFKIANATITLNNAAVVCRELQQGKDLPEISQELADSTEMDVTQGHIFASEALLIYPDCHG
jgi:hypothetical protein